MAVTFGTPVVSNYASGTSLTCVMSSVVSGQPIVLTLSVISTVNAPTISDNFATPYTWTQVQTLSLDGSHAVWQFIGTRGAGTSGTITVSYSSTYMSCVAIPCVGASTAGGLLALDSYTTASNAGTTTESSVSLTPGTSGEGAVYAVGGGTALTAAPGSPWTNTYVTYSGSDYSGVATYASPSSGSALTTSWTQSSSNASWAAGLILLPAIPIDQKASQNTGFNVNSWVADSATGFTADPAAGAFLFCVVYIYSVNAGILTTVTPPAGWTSLPTQAGTSPDKTFCFCLANAPGSVASYTFTASGTGGYITNSASFAFISFTGVPSSAVQDFEVGRLSLMGNPTDTWSPGLVPAASGELTLVVHALDSGSGTNIVTSTTGFTRGVQDSADEVAVWWMTGSAAAPSVVSSTSNNFLHLVQQLFAFKSGSSSTAITVAISDTVAVAVTNRETVALTGNMT